jgi:hypothetical protein
MRAPRKAVPKGPSFAEKIRSLSLDQQQMVADEVDRLLAKQIPGEPEAS